MQPLERVTPDEFRSSGSDTNPTRYPVINGIPILVDFTDSVLDERRVMSTAGGSPVVRRRYSGPLGAVRRLMNRDNKVTLANVADLAATLIKQFDRPTVLVIGGGTVGQGMKVLYDHSSIKLVCFDIYSSPLVHFVADAHKIPLPDGSFDAVIVQAVLEHVIDPVKVVSEVWRVLRPAGFVYAETPFLQPVHEAAYDFTRFTERGHRQLFHRFATVRSGATTGAGASFVWAFEYFIRSLFRSRLIGKVGKVAVSWLCCFDRLIPCPYAIDAACGVYFLGMKTDQVAGPREVVAGYQGSQ